VNKKAQRRQARVRHVRRDEMQRQAARQWVSVEPGGAGESPEAQESASGENAEPAEARGPGFKDLR
jgi:hypothetical protein